MDMGGNRMGRHICSLYFICYHNKATPCFYINILGQDLISVICVYGLLWIGEDYKRGPLEKTKNKNR